MKKILSFLLSVSIILSVLGINAVAVDTEMSLSVTKKVDDWGGIALTIAPVTITAVFDNGTNSSGDSFIKKSWLRVDSVENDVDLLNVYNANKEKEVIINKKAVWRSKSYRAVFEKNVTLNGIYIFCGWTSDNEAPDYISSIEVTGIETERPMAEVEFTLNGDFSKDIVATAKIRNMECGKGASIKRYALVKDYELPPGAWPESLPPEYCNKSYDERIAELYDEFVNGGLFLGEDFTESGSEVTPVDGVYHLRDVGDYILFIEDSNGKYSALKFHMPSLEPENTTPPDIGHIIVTFNDKEAQVKVTAEDEDGIAKFNYAVLKNRNIEPSGNGTDEYFLEKERIPIESETITIDSPVVVCAVDTNGNASYKLIPFNEGNLSTPEPSPTATAGVSTPEPSPEATTDVSTPEPSHEPDKDYPYEIQNISIINTAGEILSSVPDNTSFIVDMNLNKVKERNSKDYLFVAVYDTNGALISLDYVKADFAVGNDYSFGFNIPAQDKTIGSIKAYVWSSFGSMETLADTKTLSFIE